jgi:hypothetical protein
MLWLALVWRGFSSIEVQHDKCKAALSNNTA